MAGQTGEVTIEMEAYTKVPSKKPSNVFLHITEPLDKWMQQRLADLPGETHKYKPLKIFRIPACHRGGDKTMYEPLEVSIGPHYHGRENLRTMEEYKWMVLRDFLSRNPEVGLDVYHQEMKDLEAEVRKCYSESISLESDEFVMMLLLDGCFILEYFLKRKNSEFDALFGVTGWSVKSDLLLLENQIPFFVIDKLYNIVQGSKEGSCNEGCSLLKLLVIYFPANATFKQLSNPSCKEIDHLLHLFYRYLISNAKMPDCPYSRDVKGTHFSGMESRYPWRPESTEKDIKKKDIAIPCAHELNEAGIKFKLKNDFSHIFDVTFSNGIIKMPLNVFHMPWCRLLMNIVALEQNLEMPLRIATSYAQLMDLLIDSEKDVALLQKHGVIENWLGNEEAAASFCNQLGRCGTLDISNHYFLCLMKTVGKYARTPWHSYRARLKHDYFNYPWSSISLLAASTLLVLTFVQTYYSVFPRSHN